MPSTSALGFRISAHEVIMPLPTWPRCPQTMFSRPWNAHPCSSPSSNTTSSGKPSLTISCPSPGGTSCSFFSYNPNVFLLWPPMDGKVLQGRGLASSQEAAGKIPNKQVLHLVFCVKPAADFDAWPPPPKALHKLPKPRESAKPDTQ